MRLIRTTLPAVALSASVLALTAGVVISTVEARHHHKAQHQQTSLQGQQLSNGFRSALAGQLGKMSLPAGIKHTRVCPITETPFDVCFAGSLTVPVGSEVDAAEAASGLLRSTGISVDLPFSCNAVLGGPQGSGYSCADTGTYNRAALATLVFVSNPGHHPRGIPDIDAIVSVQSVQP